MFINGSFRHSISHCDRSKSFLEISTSFFALKKYCLPFSFLQANSKAKK